MTAGFAEPEIGDSARHAATEAALVPLSSPHERSMYWLLAYKVYLNEIWPVLQRGGGWCELLPQQAAHARRNPVPWPAGSALRFRVKAGRLRLCIRFTTGDRSGPARKHHVNPCPKRGVRRISKALTSIAVMLESVRRKDKAACLQRGRESG